MKGTHLLLILNPSPCFYRRYGIFKTSASEIFLEINFFFCLTSNPNSYEVSFCEIFNRFSRVYLLRSPVNNKLTNNGFLCLSHLMVLINFKIYKYMNIYYIIIMKDITHFIFILKVQK